jgi:uncharacterized repeat protein (TIGR03837 family)
VLFVQNRKRMTVDILCSVVDNLGDIGFAYRLVRALSELPDAPRIRLIVDDLASFALLCPGVNAEAACQTVDGTLVVRAAHPGDDAVRLFLEERPRMVLELYACGRPDWFESILFDESDPVPRHIINVEYLTAEPWSVEFHRLPSMTRSPLVKKSIFMPGFVPGTGGLVQDAAFRALVDAASTREGKLALRQNLETTLATAGAHNAGAPHAGDPAYRESFWVTVFSYERDYTPIVAGLAKFGRETPVLALVAAGRSAACFLDAWERAGKPFPVRELPMLSQPVWDTVLVASDFAIVRGEESFARAALAGNPFLWQCYPFGTGGQLPKVRAFLDVLSGHIDPSVFAAYERLTLAFNNATGASGISGDGEMTGGTVAIGDLASVLGSLPALFAGFASFSRETRNLGNLADNLLTFMREVGYTA